MLKSLCLVIRIFNFSFFYFIYHFSYTLILFYELFEKVLKYAELDMIKTTLVDTTKFTLVRTNKIYIASFLSHSYFLCAWFSRFIYFIFVYLKYDINIQLYISTFPSALRQFFEYSLYTSLGFSSKNIHWHVTPRRVAGFTMSSSWLIVPNLIASMLRLKSVSLLLHVLSGKDH